MWLALSESTSASKGLTELVVCTENSNPDAMVVKPAEYRVRTNDSSLGSFSDLDARSREVCCTSNI
jgi:hypothetical protein